MIDLEEWERMEAQCTKGEWWDEIVSGDCCIIHNEEGWVLCYPENYADPEAICYFRNNAKSMADEVKRLRERLTPQQEAIQESRANYFAGRVAEICANVEEIARTLEDKRLAGKLLRALDPPVPKLLVGRDG